MKLGSIGDVVHTLPAVAALKRARPGARISWVVDVRAAGILKDSPAIDELIEVDLRRWRRGLLDRRNIEETRLSLKQLRGAGSLTEPSVFGESFRGRPAACPDVAIDFQGLVKSGLIAFLSGARRRIGFASYDLREKASRYFLTEQVQTGRAVHVIEKNIELAEALAAPASSRIPGVCTRNGNPDDRYEFPIYVAPEDQRYIDDVIAGAPRVAIINPGGGWVTKLWPAIKYAEIADWLWSEYGIESLVTYGPGEEDLAQAVTSASRSGMCKPLRSTLKQFVALARRARLFVGGDTGPLHLAAAAGTPIVGLYGPTSPDRNGPFNKLDITVGRDLWCRIGCHRRKCWHWDCMEIPTVDVKRAIKVRLSTADAAAENIPGANKFLV